MSQPFFSIIIPLYNKESVITDTLNSITNQTYSDFEIIVVNDGSTDNSEQVVRQLNDNRIRIINKVNGGPSSARNCGMAEATGKYVYFLDGDDCMTAGSLKTMHNVIIENLNATVFCFNYYISQNGERHLASSRKKHGYIRLAYFNWLLREFFPCPGTIVYKNGTVNQNFKEQYYRWEDTEFFFNIMRTHKLYYYNFPVFEYNQDSLSASLPRKKWEQDYICNLQLQGKSFGERLCLYRLYLECCNLYPDVAKEKYGNTFNKFQYIVSYSLMMRLLSFKWRNRK